LTDIADPAGNFGGVEDDPVDMKRALMMVGVAALALTACGSSDGSAPAPGAAVGVVAVSGAWARTSAAGQSQGAVYFEISAAAVDTLLGVSVPASVAGTAEIHEVVAVDAPVDTMAGDTGEMVMTMRQVEGGLALPAGDTVTFGPGGFHVMLFDLVEPLAAGATFDLTLQFAHADPVTVPVVVADTAP
jgi:periplasmic copper chaperone A